MKILKKRLKKHLKSLLSGEKNIFCRFGGHHWKSIGFQSLVFLNIAERCSRCRKGRVIYPGARTITYTAEQMDALIKEAEEEQKRIKFKI